ncbi:pentatricopeptide repeat-containing protein At3g07290, mitochondrial [Euphorbia lathyris]|uniref:pentatricopeptide repeat-containing protein At3g07290, mitochondrial n=1 Tax=Euphorbia lathyris TaxID=212925 RepID=UPI0033137EFD
MLLPRTKLTKIPLLRPTSFISVSLLSTYDQTTPETINDDSFLVSSLIKNPNWDGNTLLKSMVSHMPPHTAHKIIQLHRNDTDLGVRFFNWVCKQSSYCYDIDSKIHLLGMVVSSNLFGVAHKVIIEMIRGYSCSEFDILKLMNALDELRDVGFRLNYPCYSFLLTSLAKVSLGYAAFLVYKKMVADGFVVGIIDYKSVINALCKNGYVKASEMFLCRVLKLGFDFDTHICTSLVLGFCREHALEDAFKVFEKMSKTIGCEPNSVTYSTLIHGLTEVGKVAEAFELKEEMSKKGCLPSTRTYTILIKAVCDNGLIDKALSLLNEMVGKGCKPNVHSYTVLIDGLCRKGMIEEANGMFKKMLQGGICPCTITYNALINGYCKDRQIVKAFEILGLMEMRNCKPNIRTYNELMEGLCRVNKCHKAMLLLNRIIDNGLSPNTVTYNILVDGFCKEGQLDLAFKIFYSMQEFACRPDKLTFTAMIDGLCKFGKPELADGILGLMMKNRISPDEVALTALMDGYYKIGRTKDALMLFIWMIENLDLESPHAFNVYIDLLCKNNRLREEFAMFGKILKHGLIPSVVTYTILIDGLCRIGDVDGSMKMLELMKQAGCAPNVYTYTVVINGLCQVGRIQEAETLIFGMSELGVHPNHITYTVLVKAHANSGRLEHALETVDSMVKSGFQPNNRIYSALISEFALSNKSTNHSNQLDACCLSPEGLDYGDDILGHAPININVEHALELAERIEKCGVSATGFYDFLTVSLCKEGRIVEAENLVRDKVKCGLFPCEAVSRIIEWQCRESRYDHCLEFVELIFNNGYVPSFESCCLLIQGLDNEGKSEQAQSLVSDLIRKCGVEEKTPILPYIDFLVKGDATHQSHDFLSVIDQLHVRERPVI